MGKFHSFLMPIASTYDDIAINEECHGMNACKTYVHWFPSSVCLSGIMLLLLGIVGNVSAEWDLLEGEAVDLETEQLVYRERHSMGQGSDGRWIMESDYLDAEGALFAERTVWFDPKYPQRPDYQLIDYRDNFEEGAKTLPNGDVELYRVIDGKRSQTTIAPSEKRPLVIDAGFSALVATRWDELISGKRVTFDFASSARLTTIEFRLSRENNLAEDGVERFVLEPSNWFVRMLVKSIVLTYSSQNKTLIGYEGLSNIRKDGGGNHTVRITFPRTNQFWMRQLPSD